MANMAAAAGWTRRPGVDVLDVVLGRAGGDDQGRRSGGSTGRGDQPQDSPPVDRPAGQRRGTARAAGRPPRDGAGHRGRTARPRWRPPVRERPPRGPGPGGGAGPGSWPGRRRRRPAAGPRRGSRRRRPGGGSRCRRGARGACRPPGPGARGRPTGPGSARCGRGAAGPAPTGRPTAGPAAPRRRWTRRRARGRGAGPPGAAGRCRRPASPAGPRPGRRARHGAAWPEVNGVSRSTMSPKACATSSIPAGGTRRAGSGSAASTSPDVGAGQAAQHPGRRAEGGGHGRVEPAAGAPPTISAAASGPPSRSNSTAWVATMAPAPPRRCLRPAVASPGRPSVLVVSSPWRTPGPSRSRSAIRAPTSHTPGDGPAPARPAGRPARWRAGGRRAAAGDGQQGQGLARLVGSVRSACIDGQVVPEQPRRLVPGGGAADVLSRVVQ